MKFDIKNRFSGEVQFTAEIDCSDDAALCKKLRLSVSRAIKTEADLRGANLSRADLSGADMRGANLSVLQTDIWTAYIQPDNIRIGCKYHGSAEWFSFDDEKISEMHPKALEWWKRWKEPIRAIHATFNVAGR